MKKYEDSIGKIYLYLFSMLGLVLIVIGTSGLINLGLKTLVFDTTDPWTVQPPMPYWTNRLDVINSCDDITEEDKNLMNQWLNDYENWDRESETKYSRYRNNESAAKNLSLLLVGLPLFLFHWRIIRKKD